MLGGGCLKRLVILTIGKTHSGKSTFSKMLEAYLPNSIIIDQDNHAAFINTYYKKLQLENSPNHLKIGLSNYMLHYTVQKTNLHIILCNSNIKRADRTELMESYFPQEQFSRIIIHFNLKDEVLQKRIFESKRSTTIFRDPTLTFEQLLARQHNNVEPPQIDEADYIITVDEDTNLQDIVYRIIQFSALQI